MEQMNQEERVGVKFDLKEYLKTRDKTIEVVMKVASLVFVGMSEQEGARLIDSVLEDFDCEKKWHPNKFRIGVNTLKSFREKSDPSVRLKENDIFFIDIGPVFNGHEGDYGRTFVLGEVKEYLDIQAACEKVFEETAKSYQSNGLTGVELYQFAQKAATKHGYILNLKMHGHRLGDFPHALYSKNALGKVDFSPKENLWVLEILLRHPNKEFGAFIEDLLWVCS